MVTSNIGLLVRRLASLAAVAAAGFFSGWSALGVMQGIVFAIALTSGVAVALFRGEPQPCHTVMRRGHRNQR
jgi:hypothetical protein